MSGCLASYLKWVSSLDEWVSSLDDVFGWQVRQSTRRCLDSRAVRQHHKASNVVKTGQRCAIVGVGVAVGVGVSLTGVDENRGARMSLRGVGAGSRDHMGIPSHRCFRKSGSDRQLHSVIV
jgi:hypothetical protein